jgi:sugar lactone lactonase YvrE
MTVGSAHVLSRDEVELALDARAEMAEGPLWDPEVERLLWVDAPRGRVHSFRPSTHGCRNVSVGQPVGALALMGDGGLALAVRDGFARLDPDSERLGLIAAVAPDLPARRMGGGACDVAGRFWAGTIALDARPRAGALYRLDPDGRVQAMVDEVTLPSGLDWSLDQARMYFVDGPTQRIDVFAFDVETGAISDRRVFAEIPSEAGMPGGITVDAEGFVWVALRGGEAVRRYAPDGSVERTLRLPVSHPTSCAFGGPMLNELYVTTARAPLSKAERAQQPHAGGVFRCRPGVTGRPANVFRAWPSG